MVRGRQPVLFDALHQRFDEIPTGAIGLYSYIKRLSQGLRQIMCGSRKFSLDHIGREDIAALTNDSAGISGIPYIMDCDKEEVEKILNM